MINNKMQLELAVRRFEMNKSQIKDHESDIENLQHVNEHILEEIYDYKKRIKDGVS